MSKKPIVHTALVLVDCRQPIGEAIGVVACAEQVSIIQNKPKLNALAFIIEFVSRVPIKCYLFVLTGRVLLN